MGVEIICGDCRDVLKTLPDESVQCCINRLIGTPTIPAKRLPKAMGL